MSRRTTRQSAIAHPHISHQYVRSKKRQEASGRHERPAVLQDPAKGLAAVVTVLNDQHMDAIEAAEV